MSELSLSSYPQRISEGGLVESSARNLPHCHGRGFVLDEALLRSMN